MEQLGVELVLKDRVSAAADKAAGSLKAVQSSADKAQSMLSKQFASAWGKVGLAADRSAFKNQQAFAGSWSKIGMAAEKAHQRAERAAERAHKKAERLAERAKEKAKDRSFTHGISEGLGFTNLASAAFVGSFLAESFIEGARKAVEVVTEGIKKAFEVGAEHEKLRLSYRLIRGVQGGKEAMEDQERFQGQTPYTGSEIGSYMRPLYNAKMSPQAARQAFATAEDLQAKLGGGLQDYIDMMAKIQNKGGISEKMVLGLGVGQKDFYSEVAKQLGMKGKLSDSSMDALKKKAAGDKIDPQVLLNALTLTVNKQQGGIAGTGGEMASKTMAARLHKLSMLPDLYLEKLDDTPAWNAVSQKFEDLFKKLDPDSDDGKRIMGSLTAAFSKVETMLETALKPESIDAFVAGIQKAVDAAGALVSTLREAIDLINGETISKKLFQGDEGDQALANIAFKKKELSMGSFSDIERKQRENEISSLEKALTPSERADYAASNKTAPRVTAGRPTVQVTIPKIDINVHPAKDDTNHTGQKAGEEVHRQVVAAVGRAVQEMGH